MFTTLVQKLFGTANDRLVKKHQKTVDEINALESAIQSLTDKELAGKTPEFKDRLAKGASLDDILPEAFAVVREASRRTLNMRHFDVQLLGGIFLHQGMITEMRTGEGKTLVATLPVYLNALTGKGVHVVTVNDYLAERDSEWMGTIYKFLGLTVGCITNRLDDHERQQAYGADVTYGTNNEFGFDYLRDNMKFRLADMVQRPYAYAIVDEVDSILIDEARTPLIISGPAEDSSALYVVADAVVSALTTSDYEKEEKHNNVTLTEQGVERVEQLLKDKGALKGDSMYDGHNISLVHHINQALRAHTLFARDKDYIVMDGKVIIIDEFTGRMMEGRRFSDGLHQALESKEKVKIQMENQTLASVTFQNYFRLYPKLAGMSGSAMTEATEFMDIYKLGVVDLPTHKTVKRADHDDEVYRTEREKFAAVIALIKECQARHQPTLVGTASIEKSEKLSEELKKHKIPHSVLNARHHENEALIIAEAGCPGRVTIATNMAGRGTDIKLGGNLEARLKTELQTVSNESKRKELTEKITAEILEDEKKVIAAGGLYVIGTERHESRRIDNQLRGRSGRQGDPGASKFFLSLEDDLMRIFGSERLDSMLQKLGLKEGEAITHPWINRALEKAQGRVEARNYDIRKHLLKYDDVMNDQRRVIYDQRRDLMTAEDVKDFVDEIRYEVIDDLIAGHIPEKAYPSDWNVIGLQEEVRRIFGLSLDVVDWAKEEGIADKEIKDRLEKAILDHFDSRFKGFPEEVLKGLYQSILLRVLDQVWKDHLLSLDHLRQGINLRSYAQRDPLNEYKKEAFELFERMLWSFREEIMTIVSHFNFNPQTNEDLLPETNGKTQEGRVDPAFASEDISPKTKSRKASETLDPGNPETWGRVSRNADCPCESGKKYKQCHGKL
ncbi:MAG: preprotein translocase subunit SecA [Alphaproteobacteria bacterium]|nr:preprotein translocase subunit SecA [Alphaproteobacteria bacterium]